MYCHTSLKKSADTRKLPHVWISNKISQQAVLLQVIISFGGEKMSLVMLKLMAGCAMVSGELTGEHSCLQARRLYINSAPG